MNANAALIVILVYFSPEVSSGYSNHEPYPLIINNFHLKALTISDVLLRKNRMVPRILKSNRNNILVYDNFATVWNVNCRIYFLS